MFTANAHSWGRCATADTNMCNGTNGVPTDVLEKPLMLILIIKEATRINLGMKYNKNLRSLVRQRTIPTERPPCVGEISATAVTIRCADHATPSIR
jgi:hypothetical protein